MDTARSRRFVLDVVGIGDPGQSMYSHDEMRAHVFAEAEYFHRERVQAVVTGFTLTTLLSTRMAGIPLITQHAGSYIPPLFERGMLPEPSRPVQPANKTTQTPRIFLKEFDVLCAELGIPRIPSFPALLLGDLSLVTEAPEVYGVSAAEMRAWRPSGEAYWPTTRFEYTGPIFAELDLPVPPAVEEALQRQGPIVYVAITSASAQLVRDVVAEVASTGVEVIVAGTVHDVSDLAGPKVTVGGILPSHKIMPRVDLAVSAGGQGSVQGAMAAGTPVIGIPLQPEQYANVSLLQLKGAARLFPECDVGHGRLPALVREMTAQQSYRTAACAIQAAYAARNGPALSADAILRHLGDETLSA
ncbi:glycosyltransferase family 1 protein [Nordella sp. HKS 07]|uniref:glycosyltransferase n=1 Tax=Nordella sp. HKS 07 TaxID=2712222 RepID=UPI0013E1DDB0|nr:glycosyltransferase family 1 protein [Nordella sp. HKS 07]QIG49375.1 glycosyltransferase family 1 protein [Nordella sp. HKS 07]